VYASSAARIGTIFSPFVPTEMNELVCFRPFGVEPIRGSSLPDPEPTISEFRFSNEVAFFGDDLEVGDFSGNVPDPDSETKEPAFDPASEDASDPP